MLTMRWVNLLLLAALVIFALASSTLAQDSDAPPVPVVIDDVEEMAESVKEVVEEQVEEIVAEVKEEQTPPKVEQVKETVKAETKAAPTPKSSDAGPLATVKSAICSAVDEVVSKSKSLLEKSKNISKSDMKKIAAAGLGVWGVAVGVGYLTQPAPAIAVKK